MTARRCDGCGRWREVEPVYEGSTLFFDCAECRDLSTDFERDEPDEMQDDPDDGDPTALWFDAGGES